MCFLFYNNFRVTSAFLDSSGIFSNAKEKFPTSKCGMLSRGFLTKGIMNDHVSHSCCRLPLKNSNLDKNNHDTMFDVPYSIYQMEIKNISRICAPLACILYECVNTDTFTFARQMLLTSSSLCYQIFYS